MKTWCNKILLALKNETFVKQERSISNSLTVLVYTSEFPILNVR